MDHKVKALLQTKENEEILDKDLKEFLLEHEPSLESILLMQLIREIKKKK